MKIQELLLKSMKETVTVPLQITKIFVLWYAAPFLQTLGLNEQSGDTSSSPVVLLLPPLKRAESVVNSAGILLKLLLYIAIMPLDFLTISWNL